MFNPAAIRHDGFSQSSNSTNVDQDARFPRLDNKLPFVHFHYDFSELKNIFLTAKILHKLDGNNSIWFEIGIYSGRQFWAVKRSLPDLFTLDHQLHVCLFDRQFSELPCLAISLRKYSALSPSSSFFRDGSDLSSLMEPIELYFKKLTQLINNGAQQSQVQINCSLVLTWFELDNKGNHLSLNEQKRLNEPAIAAAQVIRRHLAETDNELNLDVGDLISVIAMPSPGNEWARGKKGLKTGFFPHSCVQVIDTRLRAEHAFTTMMSIGSQIQSSSGSDNENRSPSPNSPLSVNASPESNDNVNLNQKPVLKQNGKIASCLQVLFKERPSRDRLRQSGIYSLDGRVFGCDLCAYLVNHNQDIPLVVRWCCEMIERQGIIDGIYRHSGSNANINALRAIFDQGRLPSASTDEGPARDPHAVASLLKTFFRELQNPLLTYALFFEFIDASNPPNIPNSEESEKKCVEKLRRLLPSLPPPHHRVLKYLLGHLWRVCCRSGQTGMNAKNLSIVWSPNILKPYMMPLKEALSYVSKQARCVEMLIANYERLFTQNPAGNQQQPTSVPPPTQSIILPQQSQQTSSNQQSVPWLLDVQVAQRLYQSQRLTSLTREQEAAATASDTAMSQSLYHKSLPSSNVPLQPKLRAASSHDDLLTSSGENERALHQERKHSGGSGSSQLLATASKARASLKKFAQNLMTNGRSSEKTAEKKQRPVIIHCNPKLNSSREGLDSTSQAVTVSLIHPASSRNKGTWRSIPVNTAMPRSKSISDEMASHRSSVDDSSMEFMDSHDGPNVDMALSQATSFAALNDFLFGQTSPTPQTQPMTKSASKAVLVRGPATSLSSSYVQPGTISNNLVYANPAVLEMSFSKRVSPCPQRAGECLDISGFEHATPIVINESFSNDEKPEQNAILTTSESNISLGITKQPLLVVPARQTNSISAASSTSKSPSPQFSSRHVHECHSEHVESSKTNQLHQVSSSHGNNNNKSNVKEMRLLYECQQQQQQSGMF